MSAGTKIGVAFALGLVLLAAVGGSCLREHATPAGSEPLGGPHPRGPREARRCSRGAPRRRNRPARIHHYRRRPLPGAVQRGASAASSKTSTPLADLTRDNPSQQESLRQVRKLSDAKLAELRETIRLRRESGFEAALPVIRHRPRQEDHGRAAGRGGRDEGPRADAAGGADCRGRGQRQPHHLDGCRLDAPGAAGAGRCRRGPHAHGAIRRPRPHCPARPARHGPASPFATAPRWLSWPWPWCCDGGWQGPSARCRRLSLSIRRCCWWRASAGAGRESWPPCSRRWRPIIGSSRRMGRSASTLPMTFWPWASSPAPICSCASWRSGCAAPAGPRR